MSLSSKVAWTEGLFLRPQHFQQEARYLARLLSFFSGALSPINWGFHKVSISDAQLSLGKIAIDQAQGIFPDGEVFDFPDHDVSPTPIDVPEEARGCTVFLCLQSARQGDRETSAESIDVRRQTETLNVNDLSTDARTDIATIEISRLRPVLKIEKSFGAGVPGHLSVPVGIVADVVADGAVKLETGFIPSVIGFGASLKLSSFVSSTVGLLEGRAETLAARVSGVSSGGAAEVMDFMLLQIVNRFLPVFRHYASNPKTSPEDIYLAAVTLCGEFSAFTQPGRIVPKFEVYDHRDLTQTFKFLSEEVRRCLSYIGDPTATELPLSERRFGINVAEINDKTLLETSQIIVAVTASIPGEDIRRRFPKEVKIGSVDVIRDLVNVQLPGVKLIAMPVAPRQLPHSAGKVYFELERKGEYWTGLKTSKGLAMHIGGDFPELKVTLWAIRESRR